VSLNVYNFQRFFQFVSRIHFLTRNLSMCLLSTTKFGPFSIEVFQRIISTGICLTVSEEMYPNTSNHSISKNPGYWSIKYEISNVTFEKSDLKCGKSNMRREMWNVKCQVSNVKCEMWDVKFEMQKWIYAHNSFVSSEFMLKIWNVKCEM
jgi:hypothetical protein